MTPPPDQRRMLGLLARESSRSIVVRAAGFGLGFLVTAALARWCGPRIFGEFRLVQSLLNLLLPVTVLGLGAGLMKFLPWHAARGDQAGRNTVLVTSFAWSMAAGLMLTILLLVLPRWLADRVFHDPALSAIIAAGAALVLPLTLLRLFNGLYTAIQRPSPARFHSDISAKVIFLLAVLALGGVVPRSGSALVYASAFSTLVVVAILWFQLASEHRPHRGTFRPEAAGALMRYAFTMLIATASAAALNTMDSLMLGMMTSADDVGIYNVAHRVCDLTQIYFISIAAIFGPLVAEARAHGHQESVVQLARTVIRWTNALALPMTAVFLVFARPIMAFFGAEFAAGEWCLVALAAGYTIRAAALAAWPSLLALYGYERWLMGLNLAMLATNLVLNLLLIPPYGVLGAALATTATRLAFGVVLQWKVRRTLAFPNFRIGYAGMVLLFAVMLALDGALRAWIYHWLMAGAAVALNTMIGVGWALRGHPEHRQMLLEYLRARCPGQARS